MARAGRTSGGHGKPAPVSDAAIRRAVKSDPDAAPILGAEWFKRAKLFTPGSKTPISMRIDDEVLNWFRASGRGYQSRINAVLRAYVEAQR
jgi:uncharacterized protein (DUF4415 family)